MIFSTINSALPILLGLSSLVVAAPRNMTRQDPSELSLYAQLQLADTAVDRYKLLPNDESFVYDFSKTGAAFANHKNFPALVGTGGSMAIATFEPCSMSHIHIHPRAAELFAVASGRVITQMVPESGVVGADGKQRVVRTELGPSMITVFPMGAFHTQANLECEPAITVASFTSEEPGASLIAAELFSVSDDTIVASFGGSIASGNIDAIRSAIPKNILIKLEECAAKCGIKSRRA
ncbi:RmlC-like cupin [Thozetella sp. PMI_491]|nr:RmlC-like cupin [Thozetella sp. PMI_491]